MEYFCPVCQTKHDIGDIAADLYEICKDEVRDNLSVAFGSSEDELNELYVFLARFVNNDAKAYLTVKGSEVHNYIENPNIHDNVIEGRLVLTVDWLLEKFVDSGAYKSYVLDNEFSCEKPENVLREIKESTIFEKDMIFYFADAGSSGEKVLDHIADKDENPFPYTYITADNKPKTIMLGYRRACPHCGRILPRAVGRAPEIVIWVAGSGRPGITTSIVSVAAGLSDGRYSQYGLSMQTFLFDPGWDETKHEIEKYKAGNKILKTCHDEVPCQSILMQVGDSKKTTASRVITFIDTPVEYLDNQGEGLSRDFFRLYSKMLKHVDCIWWLISKLFPYEIDLGNYDNRNERQWKIIDASGEVPELIRRDDYTYFSGILWEIRNMLNAEGYEMPPAAVILTKTDIDLDDVDNTERYALFPIEGGKYSLNADALNIDELKAILKKDGNGEYYLEWEEMDRRANGVRRFFEDINPEMRSVLESGFPRRCYFATSAYGHAPANHCRTEKGTAPTPLREMYPLIWTLADAGAISMK